MVLIKIGGDVFMLTWSIIYFAGIFDMEDFSGVAEGTFDDDGTSTAVGVSITIGFSVHFLYSIAIWTYYYFQVEKYAKSFDNY